MPTLVHEVDDITLPSSTSAVVVQTALQTPCRAPARERWSWALYDFATTIFSMNVTTLYFAVWLVSDLHTSNTIVALGNGIASTLVVLSIPMLGALSDLTQRRRPWVIGFTLLSLAGTLLIGVIGQRLIPLVGDAVVAPVVMEKYQLGGGALVAVLAAFVLASYGHQGALPFYNAMMPGLAPRREWGRLSGMGAAMAYCGSIFGVLMITPFFNGAFPVFGPLPGRVMHVLRTLVPFTAPGGRVSTFVPTALLSLCFSLPLFILCKDRFATRDDPLEHPSQRFANDISMRSTLREAKRYPGTLRFLMASFLYQDAMGTVISYMALYAVMAMGFTRGAEATLFVVLTVPAVVGSWLWGAMTDRVGPKTTLLFIIGAWITLLLGMMVVSSQRAFWAVGACIGFIYGGVNVAERPMLLRLVPEHEAGRFFSVMVLSARAAAILGPFIWGFAVDGLTPVIGIGLAYRAAVGTIAVAMLIAFFVLRGVPVPERESA